MRPEEVLERPPKVLGQRQREQYFEDGYVVIDRLLSQEWLVRIDEVSRRFIESSREVSESNGTYYLEAGHSSEAPRLQRLNGPVEKDPLYWQVASESPIVDVAEDLLGPSVRFHHSKLNFKWSGGGAEIKWHQDIQFWPHTDYSPLTIGIYLDDVDSEMGPMGIVPRSHRGPLFELRDAAGEWTGYLSDDDLEEVSLDQVSWLEGAAGSVTVHNCRCVHGSVPNQSDRPRPLLLNVYSPGDSVPITPLVAPLAKSGTMVRGEDPGWVQLDPRPCPMPPLPGSGYRSVFDREREGRHGFGETS
ncbi:MAG: phytanoyl-CoA dioxygenase family protein [Acidobacteriota bacterium]|nr:phytanoyl-CoA dioxygenase family protein [Acidobacteriota bacterium]